MGLKDIRVFTKLYNIDNAWSHVSREDILPCLQSPEWSPAAPELSRFALICSCLFIYLLMYSFSVIAFVLIFLGPI